jgi:FPC/CPF motif-containing protein YcgG
MRGLDGNYINTQGDALARLQVAYQAEQNRQQLRAQTEAADSLRKLRERVNEAEKQGPSAGPYGIKDDQGSARQFFQDGEKQERQPTKPALEEGVEMDAGVEPKRTHIDIRI